MFDRLYTIHNKQKMITSKKPKEETNIHSYIYIWSPANRSVCTETIDIYIYMHTSTLCMTACGALRERTAAYAVKRKNER